MAWLPVCLWTCSAIWKPLPSLYSSGCPSENPHALTVSPFKAFSPQPPKFFKPLMPVKEEHKKRMALEARPLLSQEVNVWLLSTVRGWSEEGCSLQRAVVCGRVWGRCVRSCMCYISLWSPFSKPSSQACRAVAGVFDYYHQGWLLYSNDILVFFYLSREKEMPDRHFETVTGLYVSTC